MKSKKYKRIIILGPGGSGKTTLAKFISKQTGIEAIHLDKEFWLPNWERRAEADWKEKISKIVDKDSWVMDGNYLDSLGLRLEKADLVIMLDINIRTCVQSIFFRTIKAHFIKRDDLAEGCTDTFNSLRTDFVNWTKQFKTAYFPQLMDLCVKYPNVDLKLFRTRKSARNFIERIKDMYEE